MAPKLRVLMMISGEVRGENANDHFYLELSRRIKAEGCRIYFYVYAPPPAPVVESFAVHGASFLVRGLQRKVRLPKSLDILLDAFLLVIRMKPNLLIGQYSVCGNAVALLGKLFRIPAVKVVRSISKQVLITEGTVGFLHKFKQRMIAHLATRLVAVSDAVRSDLVNTYSIPEKRITVLKNCINVDDYKPSKPRAEIRQQLAIPYDCVALLMVAAFQKVKGHLILMEALTQLDNSRIKILFAGQGPLFDECQRTAHELKLDNCVSFLGQRKDVADLLSAADISILPSLSDAFPLFVLESMAARKPIIASNIDGIPEMVADNRSGLLVEADNSQALSQAIQYLLENPSMSRQMGEEGYRRVLSEFDLTYRVEQEVALYRELTTGDSIL